MATEASFAQMVLNASFVVQLIILLLIVISLLSWTAIFKKRLALRRARRAADAFEDEFWSGTDLRALYNQVRRNEDQLSGLEAIFLAGFQEFIRQRQRGINDPEQIAGGAQRAMRAALAREAEELDVHLPMLATVGSTSPYIGLFGTVWGIMSAFRALSGAHTATLTQVAPGIAEALITTALGLIAAIPAVIAYNRASSDVDRLLARYEMFSDEFINILQRQSQRLQQQAQHDPAPAEGAA